MKKHESAEDYLETILMLQEKQGYVRSIDIANELNYSKPSVSIAMKKLREEDCIEMTAEGYITLLPKGLKIAADIYERHQLLSKVFVQLGVDPETAVEDACRVEHDLSEITYQKLKEHVRRKEQDL